jgi:hypothetical protein
MPVKTGKYRIPKGSVENISWDKCIVCQRVSLEQRVNMRDVGKSSFVEAMSTRKNSVFEKVGCQN